MGKLYPVALTFILAAIVSGCFQSTYDISAQLQPEFPVSSGEYKRLPPGSEEMWSVVRDGTTYRAVRASPDSHSNPEIVHLRFFQVPESPNFHIVQRWSDSKENKVARYQYIFALVSPAEVVFWGISPGKLPGDLARLVKEKNEKYQFETKVRDGPKHTIHVLREVLRRRIALERVFRFERQGE